MDVLVDWLWPLAMFVGFALALQWLSRKLSGSSKELTFKRRASVISKIEQPFYHVLQSAAGDRWTVLVKTPLIDVLQFDDDQGGAGLSDYESQRLDFLLCEPSSLEPQLAVMLDEEDSEEEDWLAEVLSQAEIPLARVKAAKRYVAAELRTRLEEAIDPPAAS